LNLSPLYARELELAGRLFGRYNIGLSIYDDNPDRTEFAATLRFVDNQFKIISERRQNPGFIWEFDRSDIKRVVENPDGLVFNPQEIDDSCLVKRIGIEFPKDSSDNCNLESPDSPCADLKSKYDELVGELDQLKDARGSLVTATRLSCLTNFVSGVAHEINNPAGVIKSGLNNSRRSWDKIEKELSENVDFRELTDNGNLPRYGRILRDNLDISAKALDRITAVVKSLASFSKLDQAECQYVDIHDGIESALKLLSHESDGRIGIEKKYGRLPRIMCYPSQINHVFLNLLKNAMQAIEKSGKVIIETTYAEEHVYVKIQDNGKGIPAEHMQSLFDIDFKKSGNRVKMRSGLTSSLNIIRNHNGDFDIQSEPGEGTTVTLSLPIVHTSCGRTDSNRTANEIQNKR
jgi:signal transduction histidine kinase